ncbi:MAG: hypothetical protein HY875_17730 [Chloroflexi bacterium]|nr:hypothetical protein [Chloroflexota bacterium]
MARVPEGSTVDTRPRPALVVAVLPAVVPALLLCGISSRVANSLEGWDIILSPDAADFTSTGLHVPSVIRPSWLVTFPNAPMRLLGRVSDETLGLVRQRLVTVLEGTL